MNSIFAATFLPFLRQTKCKSIASSPAHLLVLIASLIQTSSILFMSSSSSSGDDLFTVVVNPVPSTRVPTTPTTKTPTPTNPCIVVEGPDMLELYLTVGTLFISLLVGLATVCSRARPQPTNKNHTAPRRNPPRGQRSAPPPPPANDPTNNDETNDETEDGGSDSNNSGDGNSGSGDGDGDNSKDTTDEQEADDSQSEKSLRAEPNPEDPPPPPPTTLNENDDGPQVTLYGPIFSLLHLLLGAAVGFLARLVTMNATNYRQELQRLFRRIKSYPISMEIDFPSDVLSDSSTVKTQCPCQHRPFVVATARTQSPLRTRRVKISLPPPFTRVFRYITYAITRVSRTYIYVIDNIRPLVNWLIHAMTDDLAIIEACTAIAIDRIRAADVEHGHWVRPIAGCTILVLVVLEVYHAEPLARPADTTNTDIDHENSILILFPFADVDLPLDDTEFLRSDDARADYMDRLEDNTDIFPFHEVDLPLVEARLDNLGTAQTPVLNHTTNIENDNDPITVDDAESPISESEVKQSGQAVLMDHMPASSSHYVDVEQTETQILQTSQDIYEANNIVSDEALPSTSDEGYHSATAAYVLNTEDTQCEGIPAGAPSSKVLHIEDSTSMGEDLDTIIESLYGLFNSSFTALSISEEGSASPYVSAADGEEIVDATSSSKESHIEDEATVEEEDPDTISECLADFFDPPLNRSLSEEESASGFLKALASVSSRKVQPGGACVRAFTSCEALAAMFGFENEKPLEFLQPLPARLERLLPPFSIFPSTPARYITLDAPPATPTTPYARWVQEEHQTTPFIPSPFALPRTPPHTPPTIVIPSPTSSEGTQPPDESPAAIRARRLDRKWAKMMEKRQRNDAKYIVPRVRIEETSLSSIASDTSVQSFFDPHASINQGIQDPEIKAVPSKLTKWKPRSPGDPVPRKRRRWRNKDVLVGAGEDESYGAVGVAID